MDPPPSTQLSEVHTDIFHNPDGSPIAIFAEAGHILNRPQLVRRLKRHGAVIRSDPKDAQIILVNPESTQGRIFARNWGNDINKVVLDSAWAGKCFAEEKALLEDEEYGGLVVLDDGGSLDDGEDQDSGDEISNPLPTPRDTPVEPVKPTQSAASHPQTQDNPYSYPASQQASRTSPDFANAGPSRTSDMPQAPVFPGMDMAAMAQFMQQYAPTMASPQMSLMMNPQQAAMMQMFPAGFPFAPPQPNPMMQSDPFWLAVQDTMMNKGLFPGQAPPPALQRGHGAYPHSEPASPVQQQVLPFPPVPMPGGASAKIKGKQREVTPSTKRRKVSASSFQEAVPKLGKTNGSKTNGLSMGPPSEKKIFMTSSGPLAFFVQVGGHNRFGLVQSIKKNGGIIVTSVNDADYVILFPPAGGSKTDKTHESFIGLAQTAGQPAVSARFIHDCLEQHAVLDTEPYQFSAASHKRKRTTRSTSPIDPESEDDDDEQPAEPEPESGAAPEVDEAERKRLTKNLKERERRQRLQNEQQAYRDLAHSSRPESPLAAAGPSSQKSQARGRPKKSDSLLSSTDIGGSMGPPSPIPPGKHTQVMHYRGYKFSAEENAFAIEYGKILVERNHEVSMSAVSNAIYLKLPHHTLKSWRTHLPGLVGFDIDEWRKRAGIAFRKTQNAKQTPTTTPVPPSLDITKRSESSVSLTSEPLPIVMSPAPMTPIATPNIPAQTVTSALEEDLVVISAFFAAGNDDQTESEDAIWAKLTSQTPCQTEVTWEDFYQRHSEEVQRRYQNLIDAQAMAGQ